MPKDIRSYFLSTSKNKKTEKTINEEIELNRKRKKHIIVLSDSDDEPVVKSPRTEKKVAHARKKEESSTYFEVTKETVHKHFGETPVKRKKSSHKVDEDTARIGDITDLVRDVDDDSDWVSSCIDKYPKPESDSSEVNAQAEDGVDAKKRKPNNYIDNENSKINKSTINFKSLDSVASSSAKNSESGQNFRRSEKNVSPTKVDSPQKTLLSYLSPKKKTPPRINKLDITRSSIHPPKVDGMKVTKNSEQSKTKNRQKDLEGIISEETDSSFALHAISPENSDDELKKNYISSKISPAKNKICLKRSSAITSVNEDLKSTDHLLSPENSDSEVESNKSLVPKQISSTCSNNETRTKKQKNNFGKPVVQCDVKSDNKIKKSEPPKFNVNSELKFELWADKYRPVNLKQLIGQQGEKSNVNKLLKWLKSWFDNRSGKKKISRPSPWAKDDSGAYFKAALLSGPPGIGKTSTAHLVCKELNMDVVEFNASDTRSKKLLNQEIAELLSSKSLSPFMQGGNSTSRNHVLLMDEVDGMAGNEDRGGIQELIALIKNTKIPIICLCNDRNHPKIRSLVNYCFDLRFNRPRVEQIKGAMYSICYKENLKIKPEHLVEIISSTNQDIRLVLNHLSMLAAKKEENMNIKNKEIKLGAWDVARKVFSHEEHKFMSIHDKCDLFFHDYSIAPLFVHENYLNVIPYSEKGKTKQGKIELFAKAANSLCHGDLVDQVLRAQSAWSLLPAQAVFSSLIPGDILSGRVGGMINFPAWFGKNSKKNKFDRLCQEIQMHTRLSEKPANPHISSKNAFMYVIRLCEVKRKTQSSEKSRQESSFDKKFSSNWILTAYKVSASKEAICTDYSYRLRDGIVSSLITSGTEGVESSLQFLHEYNLLREDIESLTELTTWPHTKDPFSALDSKVKAAFTRAYNKRPVLTPFSTSALAKKGRKGSNEDNELGMASNEEAVEDNGDQSDQEEDLIADGMIIIKQKDKKELNKKATAKKESASSSKPRGGKRGGGKK